MWLDNPNWCSIFGSGPSIILWTFDFPLAKKSWMQSECLFLSGPICSLHGLVAAVQLSAVCRPSLRGIYPRTICSLRLSCLQTEQVLLVFYGSEITKGICSNSGHLWFATVPPCPPISWINMANPASTLGYLLIYTSHLPFLEGVSSDEHRYIPL